VLPFAVDLAPGESPYRQLVFAATRAIVAGVLAPGDLFPSVRELSTELKINPNTAHKAVQELIRDGLIEVRPGIGTVVLTPRRSSAQERKQWLTDAVEALVVEARRLGLTHEEVADALAVRWRALDPDARARRRAAAGEAR
jgi:GntR family transcriptional regulator